MVLREVFTGLGDTDGREPPSLVVQAWSETLRQPAVAETLRESSVSLPGVWARLVGAYQEQGIMRGDIPADHVARTLIGAVQGFIAQAALGCDGLVLRRLLDQGLRSLVPGWEG